MDHKVANLACGQLTRENVFSLSLSPLRIWSREMGSVVPSHASLLILYTQSEFGAYSRDSSRFPRRRIFNTPSGQSRVYRVAQLHTDDVHCRASAGTGPEALKVVPVTDAVFVNAPSPEERSIVLRKIM